jgi:hypothetical protein
MQQANSDLFSGLDESAAEFRQERAAIIEIDGKIARETAERMAAAATEEYRHECEIRGVVKMYREQGGEAVKAFLALVEKHRGQPAAHKLRIDALAALKNN